MATALGVPVPFSSLICLVAGEVDSAGESVDLRFRFVLSLLDIEERKKLGSFASRLRIWSAMKWISIEGLLKAEATCEAVYL